MGVNIPSDTLALNQCETKYSLPANLGYYIMSFFKRDLCWAKVDYGGKAIWLSSSYKTSHTTNLLLLSSLYFSIAKYVLIINHVITTTIGWCVKWVYNWIYIAKL